MNSSTDICVPLGSRENRKFYEPVVMFIALNYATKKEAMSAVTDAPIALDNPEEVFHAFVYKLGHVCDSMPGGKTVTSFTILRRDGASSGLDYWFASNQRTRSELITTTAYIETLLSIVGQEVNTRAQELALRRTSLLRILDFNRCRIINYLRNLRDQAIECLGMCDRSLASDDRLVAAELHKLTPFDDLDIAVKANGEIFAEKCSTLIAELTRIQKSQAGTIIAQRSRDGVNCMPGMRSVECWAELQHTISRLLAYAQSVQFFLLAKRIWPELFTDFRVSFVPSSERVSNPIRNKSLRADSIIGRMTGEDEEIQLFRSFTSTLQRFSLDARIEKEYRRDTFRPIVHSEILLLDRLTNSGGISPQRFMNNWMYIGSSKPTCKLCAYYFQEQGSGVEHRPTHGNMYSAWRFPDVLASQGGAAVQARRDMMQKLLKRVRKDAFDIIKAKTPSSYKEHDSITFSAMMSLEDRWMTSGSSRDVEDLASVVGQLEIDGARL